MSSNPSTIVIRKATQEDYPGILEIAEELPEWFDDHARKISIPTDILYQDVFVAACSEKVLGFIALYVSGGRLNIGWIGVRKSHHRQGLGERLLHAAIEQAKAMHISEIAVMTLGDSIEYPPYEQTRAFYLKHGFKEHLRSRTNNPGCPEELHLVKPV